MTTTDKLNTGIGTKEAAKLEAKPVIVVSVKVALQKDKSGKDVGESAIFTCKHPDKSEPIELNSIKFEKDSKIKVTGSWYNLDSDGLITKQSALAYAMRFYNVTTLKQFENRPIQTALDDKGYLAIKAY